MPREYIREGHSLGGGVNKKKEMLHWWDANFITRIKEIYDLHPTQPYFGRKYNKATVISRIKELKHSDLTFAISLDNK